MPCQLMQQKQFQSVVHTTVTWHGACQVLTCAIWLYGASSGQLAIPENLHLCLLNWLRDTCESSLIQTMYHILNVCSFKIPVLLLLINLCFIFDHGAPRL